MVPNATHGHGERAGAAMPHYTIELIPLGDDEPLRGGVPDQDTRRFANLGEALQLAREMYRGRNATAKGFRIFNLGALEQPGPGSAQAGEACAYFGPCRLDGEQARRDCPCPRACSARHVAPG